jgi:uncharacterized protein YabN with tetrapyrrole methylase and pyrophosphatase domain
MASREPFRDLIDRIARLRDPVDGCPWDRAQDHVSLRPFMLEEAYEAIAAIDSGEPDALRDELGDVLLQVVLHAQIASERGDFAIDDVIDGLINKLERRHPHVFSDATNDLPSILQRWDDIKEKEHRHKAELPLLVEARKLVDKTVIRRGDSLDFDGLTSEEQAGLEILRAIAASWRDGFEPEIALRKALEGFRSRIEEAP